MVDCYLQSESDRCYAELGTAVVKQAILDWRISYLKLAKRRHYKTLENFKDANDFLMGPLPEFYAGVDGPTLIRKMKEGLL